MRQYLNLLEDCRNAGVRQKNRTGIDTFMIPGGMMQFDLQHGFPILTTKKVNFSSIAAELVGFIRGVDNAAEFRRLGTKIWDANSNQNEQWLKNPIRKGEDDLGRIYGNQWRDWAVMSSVEENSPYYLRRSLDQFANAIKLIVNDPTSRRIIVSAWRPDELDQMALPPCHLLYQFLVGQEARRLNMTMYMRSCDMFLGVPFNISSYALLLSIVAAATGYRAGTLTMFLADVHIYENHLKQVEEQLSRLPVVPLPVLKIESLCYVPGSSTHALKWIESLEPKNFSLSGYEPHPAIKAEMAV